MEDIEKIESEFLISDTSLDFSIITVDNEGGDSYIYGPFVPDLTHKQAEKFLRVIMPDGWETYEGEDEESCYVCWSVIKLSTKQASFIQI